jgi:Domain of unknown function (DUF2017)
VTPLHGPSIRRERDGRYRLRLGTEERALLAALPAQLRELLATDDPGLSRLFPPAYPDDEESDDEYRRLVRDELLEGRLAALGVVEATASADSLDEEQLTAWLGALESLRLVLGTQLDVTEETFASELDPDDPKAPALALYGYLSWLQEQAVEALSDGLPGG